MLGNKWVYEEVSVIFNYAFSAWETIEMLFSFVSSQYNTVNSKQENCFFESISTQINYLLWLAK